MGPPKPCHPKGRGKPSKGLRGRGGGRMSGVRGNSPPPKLSMSPPNGNRGRPTGALLASQSGRLLDQSQPSGSTVRKETIFINPMDEVDVAQGRKQQRSQRGEAVEYSYPRNGQHPTSGAEAIRVYLEYFEHNSIKPEDIQAMMFQEIARNKGWQKNIAETHNALSAWINSGLYRNHYADQIFHGREHRHASLCEAGCVFHGPIVEFKGDRNLPITDLRK